MQNEMPVVIIAGEEDRLIDIDDQSAVSTMTCPKAHSTGWLAQDTWSIKPPPGAS